MNTHIAESILAKNTRAYQKIQAHFSQTRYKPWPEFEMFKEYLKPGMTVLDAGSGNSRLFQEIKNIGIHYTGLDSNASFIDTARHQFSTHPSKPQFMVGDVRHLPFSNATFDVVFCIAVLYHLPSLAFRQKTINEMARVLKPNGFLIMLNWNLWQKRFWKNHLRALPSVLRRDLDVGDCWIPWKNPQGVVQAERFGHALTRRELRHLHNDAGITLIALNTTQNRQSSSDMKAKNLLSIGQKSSLETQL